MTRPLPYSPATEQRSAPHSPEVTLWRAVALRVVADAASPQAPVAAKALEWATDPQWRDDVAFVCELAHLHTDSLVKRIKEVYACPSLLPSL